MSGPGHMCFGLVNCPCCSFLNSYCAFHLQELVQPSALPGITFNAPAASNTIQHRASLLPIASNAIQHGALNLPIADNAAVHNSAFDVEPSLDASLPQLNLQTLQGAQSQEYASHSGQSQNFTPPSPCQDARSLNVPTIDDQYTYSGSSFGIPESSHSSYPILPTQRRQNATQSADDSSGMPMWSAGAGDQPDLCFPPDQPIEVSTTGNADGVTDAPLCAGVLSADSLALMNRLSVYLTKWNSEHRVPREDEIQNLANLEGLNPAVISRFLFSSEPSIPVQTVSTNRVFQDISGGVPQSISQAAVQNTSHGQSEEASQVIRDVERYASCRNNEKCGKTKQAKRGLSNRRYKCPYCEFSSDKWDSFKRHILTKFPQLFHDCKICRRGGPRAFIASRADKIRDHLKKAHGVDGQEATIAREESKVEDFAAFSPTSCPYRNANEECTEVLSSWAEFIAHLKKHGQKEASGDSLELPEWHDPNDHDHNGNSKGGSSGSNESSQGPYTDSGGNQQAGPSGQSASYLGHSRDVNHHSSSTNYRPNNARKLREFCMHAQLGIQLPRDRISVASPRGPASLIDIGSRRIVQVPANAKYLALDYTMALDRCPHLKSFIETMRKSRTCQSLPVDVKDLLTQAITVTKDMGYQYIWIDILCDLHMDEKQRSAIYAEATFIIFTRGHRPEVDSMNLVICHDRSLQTVRSWTENTETAVWFSHVHKLGRGSFGLVDKVELKSRDNVQLTTTTEREFARKKFIRWRVGDPGRPAHLQEIESLRKFDHPNIARFVAAYIEDQAFNVVMLPVADCDLKRYLLQPSKWPEKLGKISKWFISLASAVRYLHEDCRCRHGDLKPENILMVGDDVSITDLGFAQSTRRGETTPKRTMMTPKYCAPGSFKGKTSTPKSDIFSLGCVFLEIITIQFGRTLKELNDFILKYSSHAEKYVIYCKHINSMQMWLRGLEECKPSAYQWTVIKLCIRMLDPEARERPSATEICSVLEEQKQRLSVALLRRTPLLLAQPAMPTVSGSAIISSTFGEMLDIATRGRQDSWTSIDFWSLPKSDIHVAELILANLCTSVVTHGNKPPEQLESLRTCINSYIKPGLSLEDVLIRLLELLHMFLFGHLPASAAASQVQFTSGHNAQRKWEHALRSLKHIIRTTKRLSARKGTLKPMITTSTVVDLDEQIAQSLDALDLKTHSNAVALTRSAPSCPSVFEEQMCQDIRRERRKRAMSRTLSDNPPAKKKSTSDPHIQWEDANPEQPKAGLIYFDQVAVTFERGNPVPTNVTYHNGAQYFQ